MTHQEIYSFSLLLLIMLNFFLLIQVMVFKFYWDFPNNSKVPTMMLTIVFLVLIMFNPLRILYPKVRKEICIVLGHIIVAPLGLVRFRHFFLADVITSAKLMFNDTDAMFCFYTSGEFNSPKPITCTW